MNSNHVLLFVVMSLVISVIVSSSGLKARALQPDPNYFTADDCGEVGPHSNLMVRCCWDEYDDTGLKVTWCQICQYDSKTGWSCLTDPYTPDRLAPTNPPMTTKATGPLNNANAPPTSNTTTGSPPLKSTTGLHNLPINKAGGSNTAPNNPTILSTHHHKTSNLGQTSGSASTGNSTGR